MLTVKRNGQALTISSEPEQTPLLATQDIIFYPNSGDRAYTIMPIITRAIQTVALHQTRIAAIAVVRQLFNLSIAEAKALTEALLEAK